MISFKTFSMMGILQDTLSNSRPMFCISMYKDALEKMNILDLSTPNRKKQTSSDFMLKEKIRKR